MFVMIKQTDPGYSYIVAMVGPFATERQALDWVSSNIPTDDWKLWQRFQITSPEAYDE